MNIKEKGFKNHMFSYILIPLVVIIGGISYYRFVVLHDYVVGYEGSCDPNKEKCFSSCEGDACTEEHYYSKVQKYAPDLLAECGKDITNCEAANICLPSDRKCAVIYCDPNIDGDKCKAIIENTDSGQDTNLTNSNQNNL